MNIEVPDGIYHRAQALGLDVEKFIIESLRSVVAKMEETVTAATKKQTEEKKMGRPKSSETGEKLKWRSVGLEPVLWDRVLAVAAARNLTANEFIRRALLDATKT